MATNNVPTFADTGTIFNDTTTFLEGGLWQNVVSEGGQGLGSAAHVVSNLQTVQANLQAGVANGQFTGAALTDVQKIIGSLGTEISAAQASVAGGGAFGSVAAAETALRNTHLSILNTVANNPDLAAMATANGATGFQAVPAGFAAGVTAQNAPHGNLAEIGTIFNDAANKMIGGVNSSNIDAIRADINTAQTSLHTLMAEHPDQFGGLTGIHADTIVRQLALENKFLNQVGTNPDAGRALNDNMLDIIDIVQGDTNLANMASQGGVNGFSAFPAKMNPTPKYQDNADQTNFWANFIAQSNSLGDAAQTAVANGDKATINKLIGDLRTFEKNSANFDMSQGGIFEARFDNELAKGTSTLGAEVAAMIKGLKTGNAALVSAAAQEMHANAADVGGNNIPLNGTAYNADGRTAADVLGQAQNNQNMAAAAPANMAGGNANAAAPANMAAGNANAAAPANMAAGNANAAAPANMAAGNANNANAAAPAKTAGGTAMAAAPANTAQGNAATDQGAHKVAAGQPGLAQNSVTNTAQADAAAQADAKAAAAAANLPGHSATALTDMHADGTGVVHDFTTHNVIDHHGHLWG